MEISVTTCQSLLQTSGNAMNLDTFGRKIGKRIINGFGAKIEFANIQLL